MAIGSKALLKTYSSATWNVTQTHEKFM